MLIFIPACKPGNSPASALRCATGAQDFHARLSMCGDTLLMASASLPFIFLLRPTMLAPVATSFITQRLQLLLQLIAASDHDRTSAGVSRSVATHDRQARVWLTPAVQPKHAALIQTVLARSEKVLQQFVQKAFAVVRGSPVLPTSLPTSSQTSSTTSSATGSTYALNTAARNALRNTSHMTYLTQQATDISVTPARLANNPTAPSPSMHGGAAFQHNHQYSYLYQAASRARHATTFAHSLHAAETVPVKKSGYRTDRDNQLANRSRVQRLAGKLSATGTVDRARANNDYGVSATMPDQSLRTPQLAQYQPARPMQAAWRAGLASAKTWQRQNEARVQHTVQQHLQRVEEKLDSRIQNRLTHELSQGKHIEEQLRKVMAAAMLTTPPSSSSSSSPQSSAQFSSQLLQAMTERIFVAIERKMVTERYRKGVS